MSWLSSVSHAFSRTLSASSSNGGGESSTDLVGLSNIPDDDDGAIAYTVSTRKKRSGRSNDGSSRSSNTSQTTDRSMRSAFQPATPQQLRSPRSLSASGSHIMSGILNEHPHFSVFRKSASQQSLEEVLAVGEEDQILEQLSSQSRSRSYTRKQQPAAQSPSAYASRHNNAPQKAAATSDQDDSGEFHLSSVEEGSLQFGEDASPPARTGPSPHSQQVVFSPLGISSSPLVVKDDPPSPSERPGVDASPLADIKTILKSAGTPGTGKSVRFTSSTRQATSSPSSHFAPETPQSANSSTSSKAGPSFLQKLQAVIPSPESSLVESTSSPPPITLSPPPPPAASESRREPKSSDESNLFETSAPTHDPSASVDDWSHQSPSSNNLNVSTLTVKPSEQSLTEVNQQTPSAIERSASFRRSESFRDLVAANSGKADELGRLDVRRGSVSSEESDNDEALVRDSLLVGTSGTTWQHADSEVNQLASGQPFDGEDSDATNMPHSDLARLALSPISERSEPNTTVDTFSPAGHIDSPTITHSSSISQILSASSSGTFNGLASRRQSGILTPSKNPFAYQGAHSSDLNLIHSLLTAQGDILANSSSQKFLLSSLVTNLRAEVDRKDSIIASLRVQKAEIEKAWQSAVDEAAEWERSVLPRSQSYRDRTQLQALEDLVERLTNELETRTSAEKRSVKKYDAELAALRNDLQRVKSDARDAEVRLRQAKVAQADSDMVRNRVEAEMDLLQERLDDANRDIEAIKRERDDARQKMRNEVDERDQIIRSLRSGDRALDTKAQVEGPSREAAERQELLVAEQAETIHDLREQLRQVREERIAQSEQHQSLLAKTELEQGELAAQVEEVRDALDEEKRLRQLAVDESEDLHARVGELETELERLLEEARLKDDELERERQGWADSRLHSERLATRLVEIERELKGRTDDLAAVRAEMAGSMTEAERLIDDRDRRLAEAQQELASKTARYDVVCKELNRTKEVVAVLRRESADREVKLAKLRKARDDLQEDVVGLNIALDAKQQEVALWKRQVSASRIPISISHPTSTARSALSTASRMHANAESPASPIVRRGQGPADQSAASNASDLASETPSKPAWRPTIGYTGRTRLANRKSSGASTGTARRSVSSEDKENETPVARPERPSSVIPLGTVSRRRSMLNLA